MHTDEDEGYGFADEEDATGIDIDGATLPPPVVIA